MSTSTTEADDSPPEGDGDHPPRGWDTDAFWYPTLDRRGALLGTAALLFVLHFDELFGLHTDATLVFGWLPIEMAYQVGLGFLHVAFMGLLYLNWPSASEYAYDEIDEFEQAAPTGGTGVDRETPIEDGGRPTDAEAETDGGTSPTGDDERVGRGGDAP